MFCPICANILVVEEGARCYRFACNTCPYIYNVTRKVSDAMLSFPNIAQGHAMRIRCVDGDWRYCCFFPKPMTSVTIELGIYLA